MVSALQSSFLGVNSVQNFVLGLVWWPKRTQHPKQPLTARTQDVNPPPKQRDTLKINWPQNSSAKLQWQIYSGRLLLFFISQPQDCMEKCHINRAAVIGRRLWRYCLANLTLNDHQSPRYSFHCDFLPGNGNGGKAGFDQHFKQGFGVFQIWVQIDQSLKAIVHEKCPKYGNPGLRSQNIKGNPAWLNPIL